MPAGLACAAGVNLHYNGTTLADAEPLAPLLIVDGGAGPDRIRVLRSNANFGVAPTTVVGNMASADADVIVNGTAGLTTGDLLLAAAPDGSKICTIMQLTDVAAPAGSAFQLPHESTSLYNPDPSVFTTPVSYSVGDIVMNLGRGGLRTIGVICGDGAAPGLTNSCDLASFDAFESDANPALADVDSIAPQVIDLQAQYGVAPAGSQTVNEWVDATGAWAAPSANDLRRIKAVRIAIVTRGNLERVEVSPASLVLWNDDPVADPADPASDKSIALDADQRMYRYKVLTVVVPLINVIWAGV
jgi:type IV pilus assembly protein PilW